MSYTLNYRNENLSNRLFSNNNISTIILGPLHTDTSSLKNGSTGYNIITCTGLTNLTDKKLEDLKLEDLTSVYGKYLVGPTANLSGYNLSGASLVGVDLTNITINAPTILGPLNSSSINSNI
jgi:uncharacterized protein YjbI with pentapeptide repeats